MNIFQLNCFLAVANSLSFAHAAKQMNVSQPAITNQIKTLEAELNAKLFRRSTRLVELTPEGQAFIADAKQIVAIAEQAKMRFSNPDDRKIETLSIGCSTFAQLTLLSDSLQELSAIYPTLHPQLQVVPHNQLFPLLETGKADVIFDMNDQQEVKETLSFQELQRSRLVGVCHPNSPLAQQQAITMQDLKQQTLIFCDPAYLVPSLVDLQWKLAEGRSPIDIHFCISAEAAVVLAAAGFGVALLPDLIVPQAESLVKLPFAEAPDIAFGVFYKPHPDDAVCKQFLQVVKRQFANRTAPPV